MKLDIKKIQLKESPRQEKSMVKNFHVAKSGKQLGELVQKLRKKKKHTQEDVAMFSNLSRLAISEFENGKSDIRLSTLLKIIKACDLELLLKEK